MEIEKSILDKVLSKLNKNELDFKDLRKEMQSVKEIALVGVSKDIKNLKLVITKFESDKDMAMLACSKKGEMLKYFDNDIKDNIEIVQMALNNNINAIEFASERIRDIKELMVEIVLLEPKAIMYASSNLKKNQKFMLKGLEKRVDLLKHIPEYAPELLIDHNILIKTILSYSPLLKSLYDDNEKKVNGKLMLDIFDFCEEICNQLKSNLSNEDFNFILEKYALLVFDAEKIKEKKEAQSVKMC